MRIIGQIQLLSPSLPLGLKKTQILLVSSQDIFKIALAYLNYGNFRCSQLVTAPAPMETTPTLRTGKEKRAENSGPSIANGQ